MSRWFAIARGMRGGELNETNSLIPDRELIPPAAAILTASSANKLFDIFNSPDPLTPQAPDPDALLALLRDRGPMTYGAAASALGWGATQAWQAEAELRSEGKVQADRLGRIEIMEGLQ